jgi:HAD superfamily hydrolase (TIGR01509 family)
MSKLKAIFFDNDGVLVDTEGLYFEVTRQALASLGVELSTEEHERINMSEGRSVFDLAEERGIPAGAVAAARSERDAAYARILRAAGSLVIPGVPEALDALKAQGLILAIVTSCRPEHFKEIHRSSGLLDKFDFIIGQGDYERHKPDPEPYLKALERAGVSPEEAVVVEDAARGVKAAVAAGIRCVAIPRGISAKGEFSQAWRRFEELSEFASLAKSL